MNRDTALAQAGTLREWAAAWGREGLIAEREGSRDVPFFLERAAKQIERCFGVMAEAEESEPAPIEAVAALRAD